MRIRFTILLVGFTLAAGGIGLGQGPGQNPTLTSDDKAFLDSLLKEFVFAPPANADRVAVKTVVRSVWGGSQEVVAHGWFVPGPDGQPGRIFFIDGYSILAPQDTGMSKVDFVGLAKARFANFPNQIDAKSDKDFKEIFSAMDKDAIGAVTDDTLAQAAWLYRLGHNELAARALWMASKNGADRGLGKLREDLAWSAFASMVHAYMVRADEEALAHGERLLKLYANEVANPDNKLGTYRQASLIVEELKRRRVKGTFGKTPPKEWPAGFDQWEASKKTAYLIEALEESDIRQDGQPGHVPLHMDRRVQELVRVGEAAVPALIDVVEKDERLTRCVHYWRDFARSRVVLGVREAALTALMDILQVRFYQELTTGGNFTSGGEDAVKEMTKKLRAYWEEHGKSSFDERMMKVLTDPSADSKSKVEAAENLGMPDPKLRTRPLTRPIWIGDLKPPGINPVVAKYTKPTVAEAILAALDKDPKARQYVPGYGYHFEDAYLSALIDLGDKRIGPELAKRAAAAQSLNERRRWATVAHFLGEPKPFDDLAEELRFGQLAIPPGANNDPEQDPLKTLVLALINVGTPAADRALFALTEAKHPQHQAVSQEVLGAGLSRAWDEDIWHGHPFCLEFLRVGLTNKMPTKATYKLEKDRILHLLDNRTIGITTLLPTTDLSAFLREAPERACDPIAMEIARLVVGVPRFHALLKTADQRMETIEATLVKFQGRFRRLTPTECDAMALFNDQTYFMPDIRPLNRAATADDVKAGKAIFHLSGKGKPAEIRLPAVAIRKADANNKQAPRLLIVQAEVDSDGEMMCGVISREAMRALPRSELQDVKSLVVGKH